MPKAANQKTRILALERIFLEESDEYHKLTLSRLHDLLEQRGFSCERKALYSDIESLRQAGMDIVTKIQGKNTVYFLGSRDFETPELYLLANAVASSKFISDKKSRQLIGKIASLCCKDEGGRLVRRILVSDRVKSTNESIYYNINSVNEALSLKRKISFLYFNYNEKKKKVYHNGKKPLIVSPRALVWQNESYYIVGYHEKRGVYANFRADKMEKVEILDETAESDPDFDESTYCGRLFGMYGGYGEHVRLLVSNDLAGVMMERFGRKTLFENPTESSFEIEAELDVSPVFFGWLFQFGDKVQILSPQGVRDEFKRFAENTLKKYGGFDFP